MFIQPLRPSCDTRDTFDLFGGIALNLFGLTRPFGQRCECGQTAVYRAGFPPFDTQLILFVFLEVRGRDALDRECFPIGLFEPAREVSQVRKIACDRYRR